MTKEEEIVDLIAELAHEIALERVCRHEGDYDTHGDEKGIKARLAKALAELVRP